MSNAGKFTIDVYEPYPVWCEIRYNGLLLCQVHHNELSDLAYAVKKAMQEARLKLKEQTSEVKP